MTSLATILPGDDYLDYAWIRKKVLDTPVQNQSEDLFDDAVYAALIACDWDTGYWCNHSRDFWQVFNGGSYPPRAVDGYDTSNARELYQRGWRAFTNPCRGSLITLRFVPGYSHIHINDNYCAPCA